MEKTIKYMQNKEKNTAFYTGSGSKDPNDYGSDGSVSTSLIKTEQNFYIRKKNSMS